MSVFIISIRTFTFYFFFLMIRRPPRSTLFPTRRSSDLAGHGERPRGRGDSARRRRRDREDLRGRAAAAPRTVSCRDRKSTRLNSSHLVISYAVFCLKKKKNKIECTFNKPERRNTTNRGY